MDKVKTQALLQAATEHGATLQRAGVTHNTPSHDQSISPSPTPSRPTPSNTPSQGRNPPIER